MFNVGMPERWLVKPGHPVRLSDHDPASTSGAPGDRMATEAVFAGLHEELGAFQDRLWAEAGRSLLVVLQAMDAGGKDGTIRHVFGGVNPMGTRVTSFKQPSAAESKHDFLWRVHQAAPAAGEIGIFNRSHYEDVLVVRVHGLVPEPVWRARFGLINSFEEMLRHGGTNVVKLFLHVSEKEQKRRLEERFAQPEKRWKLQPTDLAERRYWPQYQAAYEDVLSLTSTEPAPWYVVPSDHKWYRNWAVSRILIETLRAMDPHYPQPTHLPDPAGEAPA